MKLEHTIIHLRPKTPLIGRETPGLTMEIFRRCAMRRAKQERRKARWERVMLFLRTPIGFRWFKREVYPVSPHTKEPAPDVW